jgi:hypothetical protein
VVERCKKFISKEEDYDLAQSVILSRLLPPNAILDIHIKLKITGRGVLQYASTHAQHGFCHKNIFEFQ